MAYKIYFDINVLLDLTLQRSNFNEVELIMNEIQNISKISPSTINLPNRN